MFPTRALLLGALSCNTVAAQETTGHVRGRVITAAAAPVAGARVQATGPHLQGSRVAVSDRHGMFELLSLPPGTYTLRVTAIAYPPLVIENAVVQLGRTTRLADFRLEPITRELKEVRVSAAPLTLDPSAASIGATLEPEEYKALPGERDYASIITILPHVNRSFHGDPANVAGSTGLENIYFIDGVNVTSALSGSRGTRLPYNFVRAVEVKVGGYEAQYGRGLGALVNAVTYSGTDMHEVSTFAFVAHSGISGKPRAEPDLREDNAATYDIGARVSGPIEKGRLWYSAALNPQVVRSRKEIPGHGFFTDSRSTHVFAGKLTWAPAPYSHVQFTIFGDPALHHRVAPSPFTPPGATVTNPDPYLTRLETGGVTASVGATLEVGTRFRLHGSISRSRGRESTLADTETGRTQSQFVDEVSPAIGGGFHLETVVVEGRSAGSVRGTYSAGGHTLIAGVEYEHARVAQTLRTPGMGFIARRSSAAYEVDSQYAAGTVRNRMPIAYVQNSWRIGTRLTVNAGLRWSSQLLHGASGRIAQRFPDEWQPRGGFSLQLGRRGQQRVFGSYGRFYQQAPLNFSALNYLDFYNTWKSYSADPRQPGARLESSENRTTYEKDFARHIDGLQVEHLDEVTLGYDRMLGRTGRVTLRALRRQLRSSFQWGFLPDTLPDTPFFVIGTPGKGDFAFLPPPRREYTAAEVAVQGAWRQAHYRASYVRSRTWGNYTGLFASDLGLANPGGNFTFATPFQESNSTGLLPNDQPHVLKFAGAYHTSFGIGAGLIVTWQSGTPVNAFAAAAPFGAITPRFLVPRGSAGRTPNVSDINLRLLYNSRRLAGGSRFVIDLFHVANARRTVRVDEYRSRVTGADGELVENPRYGTGVAFQPPMRARLGIEVDF